MKEVVRQKLSIIVPAYNEQEVLNEFHSRLSSVLDQLPIDTEIIYINDGSSDDTINILNQLHESSDNVSIIDLSRNFGKEIAMSAGLHHTDSDATIIIDADLQDPPELIPELIEQWQQGHDVVYAKRRKRSGETVLKKWTAHFFYRIMRKISNIDLPHDTGDFRLLSRRAVNAINSLPEHHRFMKGLFAWIGFNQKAVLYDRDERFAGTTKWNYFKLWNFALEGITSFTAMPLKIATYFGLLTAMVSFVYGTYIIIDTILYGND
ncbi:MAG: glycosyltransferase family 2 protein, partial [Chromatiales bacterium]|nr:glycosyltransferase family 2 protein [Chromatiales bacterium]